MNFDLRKLFIKMHNKRVRKWWRGYIAEGLLEIAEKRKEQGLGRFEIETPKGVGFDVALSREFRSIARDSEAAEGKIKVEEEVEPDQPSIRGYDGSAP